MSTALRIRPHVYLSGPEGCQLCPLPLRNSRVHIDLEDTDDIPDRSEPRRPGGQALLPRQLVRI